VQPTESHMPPAVASDCAIPSCGVENHHSEHPICELVSSPILHEKRQPPIHALTKRAPLSGVVAHSVSYSSGHHGMLEGWRPNCEWFLMSSSV